jgi:hypothetical protein
VRRLPDNQIVTLLAYSLRRAWGSLLVFLVVVWLTMLAVGHIPVNVRHPGRNVDLSLWEQWRTQPQAWTPAVFEVAVTASAIGALVIVWRIRPGIAFNALLATGGVLVGFGLASFGVALANQDYRRLQLQDRTKCERACIPPAIEQNLARWYNRGIDPTPWWLAGGISTGLGLTAIGAAVATRRKRPAPKG